jgi:hypothetical protein
MTDIHREGRVLFDGVSGVLSADTVGDFGGLCNVHIHADAIANILPFSQFRQMRHSIAYEEGGDSFTIRHRGRQLRFSQRTDGLYVPDTRQKHACLVTTITENEASAR